MRRGLPKQVDVPAFRKAVNASRQQSAIRDVGLETVFPWFRAFFEVKVEQRWFNTRPTETDLQEKLRLLQLETDRPFSSVADVFMNAIVEKVDGKYVEEVTGFGS